MATATALSREMIQDRLDGLLEAPRPPEGDFSKRGIRLELLLTDLVVRTMRTGDTQDKDVTDIAGEAYAAAKAAIVDGIQKRVGAE